MRKMLLVSAALAASTLAAGQANAAVIIYDVTASFTGGNPVVAAGGLSGSFTVDTVLNKVTALNLTTSMAVTGPFTFASKTYNDVSKIVVSSLPNSFDIWIDGGGTQMRLIFAGGLAGTGAPLTTTSYESQVAAGQRFVSSGAAVARVAATPEPATWAMMIFGFGLIGLSMRRWHRQPKVRVTFA